ncbi:putative membrane protein [Leucobacter luti]|uniref:Putative membrane protein n=1 Tax=Leucobacter luti TaxID=340320 RepID=A0A4V3CYI4_9MICO|nr:YhgE/Pip domain-containing protein [Leucobacter luti]TDP94268.1 putative membrane protein [Leucobacter luti]
MRQSWQIFKRDVTRILRVRKTWVIVIGILITPALYAWFNINAFWDPYANTSNITIAVANLDEGADSELTGPVNIGEEVVEQLRDNDQLGWEFMDKADAMQAVKRGDAYASIVIPADFSADLLSMTTGTFTQPALHYFVNEKASAIAPKITDVGASQLDKQITSAFKEQVAHAATEAVTDAGDSAELRLLNARSNTLNVFDKTAQSLDASRSNIAELQDGIASSRTELASARDTLRSVDTTLSDVQTAVTEAQGIILETQQQVVTFSDAATSAYLKGTTLLSDAAASAHVSITELTQGLDQAGARISSSITAVTAVVESNEASITQLRELLADSSLDPATAQQLTDVLNTLEAQNTQHQAVLTQLSDLNSSAAAAVQSVRDASDALTQATQDTRGAATQLRTVITETVPAVNAAMSQLSASAGQFASAIGSQQTVLAEADTLLGGIDEQLGSTATALESFEADLGGISGGVKSAKADVLALGAASEWNALSTLTGLDPDQIAQFVSAPVTVQEQVVFPITSYGSAMAALFTNLSLWIGAFVLMVIFKIEVDTEGFKNVTVRQAYLGRFYLLGTLAMLQALIVCSGNLIIGVQTVNPFVYVGTGIFTALVYVSIIYALCVAFGHIGRGLCVLLVIMQIPGASGLYPIELMPGFFRAIYPLLPFSYGIDAMRETIAGFYGGHYWKYMGVLTLMMVLSFVLGLVLRRRLANFNLLFNREIASTDLMIGEKVQVVGSGYRLTDVIHAMQNRHEYRDDLARRSRPFTQHYPALLRGTLLVGGVGLVVLAIIAWALPGGKAPLLGVWVAWCLLIMGFLVVIEYIKQSFANAQKVAELNDSDLRDAMLTEGDGLHTMLGADGAAGTDGTAGANGTGEPGERARSRDSGANPTLGGVATTTAVLPRARDASTPGEITTPAEPDSIDEVMSDWFGDPSPSAGADPDPDPVPDPDTTEDPGTTEDPDTTDTTRLDTARDTDTDTTNGGQRA